jgi:hypothetical protein
MADCFPSAGDLRAKKLMNSEIMREICAIRIAIIEANEACNLQVTVCDSGMTSGDEATDYFQAWKGCNSDRFKELEMQTVIECFTNLGYSIVRITNTATNNTFCWQVMW